MTDKIKKNSLDVYEFKTARANPIKADLSISVTYVTELELDTAPSSGLCGFYLCLLVMNFWGDFLTEWGPKSTDRTCVNIWQG